MGNPITVYLVGATGRTGTSIADALLERKDEFKLIAPIRPASATKPAVASLRERGADVRVIDFATADHATLVAELRGVDAVVSTVLPFGEGPVQEALVRAAKEAGVKRFVPSDWATPCVPGVMRLHDVKAEIHDLIKELGLGYTFIDVGWWTQGLATFVDPAKSYLPQIAEYSVKLWGPGDVKTAATDLRDIGPYVARILADPRTLNKYVFIWGEEVNLNEVIALAEKVSGKKLDAERVSAEELEARLQSAEGLLVYVYEYQRSLWVRGDNTIANAKKAEYGGALDVKELYPDYKPRTLEQIIREYAAEL